MTETLEVRATGIPADKSAHVREMLVSVGQNVAKREGLLIIDTDKATLEVDAPSAGRVTQVFVEVNASVVDGDLLALLECVAPNLPLVSSNELNLAQPGGAAIGAPPDSDFHASPWIRGLAHERGIGLSRVVGSGPFGRILEEDLERHHAGAPESRSQNPSASPAGTALSPHGATETRPLSRLQRAVGRNLTANWTQIPHVTQFDEADITELEAFRVALNREPHKEWPKLSLLPFVVKAAACALAAFPEFNSELSGELLMLKRDIHIGFAVDTADGLQVPVIHHADRLPVLEIAREIASLAERARASKLAMTDFGGGSLTVSNLGGAGGTAFTPIINAPEVAIVGLSKTELKPKWNGSAFVPRLMLPLSLSYDHRVINGVAGARFTSHLASVLADMRRALL